MPNRNQQAGQALEVQRHALAEAIVARQYALQPELRKRYGEPGRAKCVEDTDHHLAHLAAAVTFSSPSLFCEYFGWAKAVLGAFGIGLEDVERNLACMRDVLNEQLPPEIREVVDPFLAAALQSLPHAAMVLPSHLDGDDTLSELARQYLQLLLRAERHEASRLILDAVQKGITVSDVYMQVLSRCQREVGRLWQLRQITVAQEHYCTAATQLVMSQLYPHLFSLPKKGRKMAAASVGGELHEVGLRIVTDIFEADGWDTIYLGANLPDEAVLKTIEQQQPDLLLISVTMAFHLQRAERLIALVRSTEAGRTIKIMVGGSPFNVDPDLWHRVRADGNAKDAVEALDVAARLLSLQGNNVRVGQTHYPAGFLGDILKSPNTGKPQSEAAVYDELSHLNNELLTTQRELARKNAQLERANARLIEAQRRKDEFLAMLAHELRNPLAPLRNAAVLLQQPGTDHPLIQSTGAMMGRQVEQLGRLVDDLLDLSRIASGKMQLRKEWVDLAQAVERAADVSRSVIESRRHELTVSLPDVPLRMLADPTRLEQILTNLLNNAARYTPEGGRIWLTASQEPGEVVFRVRDTGIGIPPEMLSSIFGLFSQIARPQERSEGGLGIGLSLVKSLTEMHGGTVEAQSEGRGKGSEFTVRWPLSPEAPLPEVQVRLAEVPAIERSLRVLLVEDNADAAESLAMLLRLWGHEVQIAHNGLTAIGVAQTVRPEVVLLDIGLPGMDGYELARRLRPLSGLETTLLVALTGWGQEEDRRRSLQAGFDGHLVKPVELSALQALLAQAGPRESLKMKK